MGQDWSGYGERERGAAFRTLDRERREFEWGRKKKKKNRAFWPKFR